MILYGMKRRFEVVFFSSTPSFFCQVSLYFQAIFEGRCLAPSPLCPRTWRTWHMTRAMDHRYRLWLETRHSPPASAADLDQPDHLALGETELPARASPGLVISEDLEWKSETETVMWCTLYWGCLSSASSSASSPPSSGASLSSDLKIVINKSKNVLKCFLNAWYFDFKFELSFDTWTLSGTCLFLYPVILTWRTSVSSSWSKWGPPKTNLPL